MQGFEEISKSIDRLISTCRPFAAICQPNKNTFIIVGDEDSCGTTMNIEDVFSKYTFIMHPFIVSKDMPILMIRGEKINFGHIRKADKDKEDSQSLCEYSECDKDYSNSFNKFIAEINSGRFRKLVLSRQKTINISESLSMGNSFIKAANVSSEAYTYMCYTPFSGIWFGSTPEQFLRIDKGKGLTVSLAGTQQGDEYGDISAWDSKNVMEQELVTDYIKDVLDKNKVKYIVGEKKPISAGRIKHIKTEFFLDLSTDTSISTLIKDLHPTPAVCGLPKQEAIKFIKENENYMRKYYSGFVGVVDDKKNIDLYVNLRCANITDQKVTLYAGSGIVQSSNLNDEWIETERKMKSIGDVLE